jgi:hypothetical protein
MSACACGGLRALFARCFSCRQNKASHPSTHFNHPHHTPPPPFCLTPTIYHHHHHHLPRQATFFQNGDPGCTTDNWGPVGGTGSSNPNSFAPTKLNVSQWVDSMVALGATEAVLTAKHGCGFYLWPTKVQLPDGSPYPYHVNATYGDVLQQFKDATSARGIGHGFYYR